MKKVAKFSKVSYEQFKKDYTDTFGIDEENIDANTRRAIESIYYGLELPQRSTKYSAGYDFHSPIPFMLNPGETIKIPTAVRCEMEEDYVLMIFVRSSIGFKYLTNLVNNVAIVDCDYFYSDNQGHIFIKLVNRGDKPLQIRTGDSIAQGIFVAYGITEDDYVENTRNGGIGSTGR